MEFTHLDARGHARMVDVTAKQPTVRTAGAEAFVSCSADVVAALRETSILFGALIAFVLLKEKVAGLRIAAALGIAGGAILLRLA